uniref:palmitoyl-protein hydrolase n=1 Tax=Meloidogyne enterolobii TaxID=390850 RepID=A0A6V7V0Q7_MELEN|nr:unnamed protein product [Meloidogyne enterolobii]
MAASTVAPPIILRSVEKHTSTLIFFHGLGDQGDGWASVFKEEMRVPYIKYIFPNAQSRPVTLNFGMRMPAWYDILGLTANSAEDEQGIEIAKDYVHGLINKEIEDGISPKRISIGGFSMGAALALYLKFIAGLTFDKPLGCIISLSGYLIQRSKLPGDHKANLKTPVFLGHGQDDFLVPYSFGQLTYQEIHKFNPNVTLIPYQCQHGTTPQELADTLTFIKTSIPAEEESCENNEK